jgi:hypothetical protein
MNHSELDGVTIHHNPPGPRVMIVNIALNYGAKALQQPGVVVRDFLGEFKTYRADGRKTWHKRPVRSYAFAVGGFRLLKVKGLSPVIGVGSAEFVLNCSAFTDGSGWNVMMGSTLDTYVMGNLRQLRLALPYVNQSKKEDVISLFSAADPVDRDEWNNHAAKAIVPGKLKAGSLVQVKGHRDPFTVTHTVPKRRRIEMDCNSWCRYSAVDWVKTAELNGVRLTPPLQGFERSTTV